MVKLDTGYRLWYCLMVTGWYIVPCMRFYYLTPEFSFCCLKHTVSITEIVSISISVMRIIIGARCQKCLCGRNCRNWDRHRVLGLCDLVGCAGLGNLCIILFYFRCNVGYYTIRAHFRFQDMGPDSYLLNIGLYCIPTIGHQLTHTTTLQECL